MPKKTKTKNPLADLLGFDENALFAEELQEYLEASWQSFITFVNTRPPALKIADPENNLLTLMQDDPQLVKTVFMAGSIAGVDSVVAISHERAAMAQVWNAHPEVTKRIGRA